VGIRKALGARSVTIVRMLIWDFSKPVLLAVVIAAPIGSYLMTQWLARFPARISLSPWMFVASAVLGVVVAWLSVGFHAASVARAKPIVALKHA
jgi:putative ABC transport system permease protein